LDGNESARWSVEHDRLSEHLGNRSDYPNCPQVLHRQDKEFTEVTTRGPEMVECHMAVRTDRNAFFILIFFVQWFKQNCFGFKVSEPEPMHAA
jgi:hypothetical protein